MLWCTHLENQTRGALANDKAGPALVERPRTAAGPVIEGRDQTSRPREAADRERVDARLGAAGDHDVGLAGEDEARGIADAVRARRARGRGGVVWAAKTVAHRDVARAQVDQQSRHEEWVDLAVVGFVVRGRVRE